MEKPSRGLRSGRRGVSQILATVVIVAITLVSSVAIGGFVFGTLGSSANTAQVTVVSVAVPAAVGLGVTVAFCSVATGNTEGGLIELYNSGTKATDASGLTLVYNGESADVSLAGGPCSIPPESSLYVVILSLPYQTTTGTPYTGYVSTANGAEVLLTGAFS